MAEKDRIMVNWINGFKAGNKKEKYEISFRLGKLTVLYFKLCLSCKDKCTSKTFRLMVFNLGFEF